MREKIQPVLYVLVSSLSAILFHRLFDTPPIPTFVLLLSVAFAWMVWKTMKAYKIRNKIETACLTVLVLVLVTLGLWGSLWMGSGYGFSVILLTLIALLLVWGLGWMMEIIDKGTTHLQLLKSWVSSPGGVFVAFATAVGITLVIITPVFVVNDESSHYFRAEQLANGQLISSHEDKIGFGGTTQLVSFEVERYITNRYLSDKKGIFSRYINDIKAARMTSINDKKNMVFAGFNNTALYSPVPYLVSSSTTILSRLGDNSIFATIIFGRLANLVTYIALTALAISIIPSKKWLLAMVALLPMSLQQAASFSGDSLTLALIFLGIAITAKLIFGKPEENLAKRLLIWAGVLAVLIGLTKQGFAPFSLLLAPGLFAPQLKKYREQILIILGAAVVGILAWYGVVKAYDIESGQVPALRTIGIELRTPHEAASRIIGNPLSLVRDVVHTFVLFPQPGQQSHDIPNYIFTTFTGRFETFFIAMPVWYAVVVIIMLILAYYRVHRSDILLGEAAKNRHFNLISKATVFLVGIGSFLITLTAMYLYATNRTANFINGFQGRYLLPVAALFAYLPHSSKRFIRYSERNVFPILFVFTLGLLYSSMVFMILYICYFSS